MARDVRQLRAEATEASASGKHKRALALYLELEQREPRDAQWSKRAAETYRRLGKDKDAIGAFTRAADRYAQGGFLVQAIAVCKLILQIDPRNDEALHRIAAMNEQIGAGPTRAIAMAESNPQLATNEAVTALRAGSGAHPSLRDYGSPSQVSQVIPVAGAATPPDPEPPPPIAIPRTRTPVSPPQNELRGADVPLPVRAAGPAPVVRDAYERPTTGSMPPLNISRTRSSTPPPLSIARTKSKPISIAPDQPLESISLKDEIDGAIERKEKSGVYVIPIDDAGYEDIIQVEAEGSGDYSADNQFSGETVDYAPGEQDGDGPPGRDSAPIIEIEDPDDAGDVYGLELESAAEPVEELELDAIEEIPLGEPRQIPTAAADALARTPLFAGLSREALESLVQQLTLVQLGIGEVLFREGDPGDALYVIVEGEVAVLAEGPPRVEMARLGAGAFLGEVALMTDQPRSATVQATEDAELLRIDRKTLSGVLATHGEILAAVFRFVRHRLVDRWTRTSPIFRPFDESAREEIAGRFKFLEIDGGTRLLEAGKRPDGLYIVLAGTFTVERNGAQVASVGPGELIGETALLSGGKFMSNVVASGKSLALCLPASEFRDLIMTHPHVLEYIGEIAEHSRKLEIL